MADSFGGRFLFALRARHRSTFGLSYDTIARIEGADRQGLVELLKRTSPKGLFLPEELSELARTWEPEQLELVVTIATRAYNHGLQSGLGNVPGNPGRL